MALAKTPSLTSQPPKNGSSIGLMRRFSLCALLQQLFSSSARCSFDTGRKETYLFCCKFLANTAERASVSIVFVLRESKGTLTLPEQNHLRKRIECFLLAHDTNFCQLQKLQSRFEFRTIVILYVYCPAKNDQQVKIFIP